MYELTNEQRACFGLAPVEDSWQRIAVKPSPYDHFDTVAWVDGHTLRKVMHLGDEEFMEADVCERLSEDHAFLLPKTERGKPVKLSSSTLAKRPSTGMTLSWIYGHISLFCEPNQRSWYTPDSDAEPKTLSDFIRWVDAWCAETTDNDLAALAQFLQTPRQHCKYKVGDYFRFPLGRRLWGYGRILADYGLMRRKKQPLWDIFPGNTLAVSIYHIVTDDPHIAPETLDELPLLPEGCIMDNVFYYGDYPIIGHAPLCERDFELPIHIGRSIDVRESCFYYQRGHTFRRLDELPKKLLPLFRVGKRSLRSFAFHSTGFRLHISLPVLIECIRTRSNAPWWQSSRMAHEGDLRNPEHAELRQAIFSALHLDENGFDPLP